MSTIRSELDLIKDRFPDSRSAIEGLYKSDPDFRSLCSDLFLCAKMIREFEQDIIEKQKALAEYCEIEKELEKELYAIVRSAENMI